MFLFITFESGQCIRCLPVHALDLGYKAPGLLPCCWASVLSADQWRLAAGRRAAIHFSGVQLCNLRGEKRETGAKTKYIGKRGNVSRHILQVLFFIFVHIVGIFFLLPQPEKPEGFKATKRVNQRRIAASVNSFIGHRKWLDIHFWFTGLKRAERNDLDPFLIGFLWHCAIFQLFLW